MPTPLNIGTRSIPLKLAKDLTQVVNEKWQSGEFLAKATPITADLLRFWFMPPHIETRAINFHEGQKQAILNAIYLHEIIGTKSVKDVYENIDFELLTQINAAELAKEKYSIPKYAVKMATGTGKTWVMHALMIWQYLNAKHEEEKSGKYSKNFLLVAPGLIVYERLLDAYLGKENEKGSRDFSRSDLSQFQELFIPDSYREEVFGFVQSSTVKKEEIGKKITGDGMIAIANWHLFMDKEKLDEAVAESALDDPSGTIKDLLPVTPGLSGGNDLNSLDAAYFRGNEIKFLSDLDDLIVINDEAHHIHENKTYGEIQEVEWQKSLNKIAKNKGDRFIQIDFSATPYDVTGSGQKRVKHFFPHIIVDYNLGEAVKSGKVKTIAIDKRKEIIDLESLDYKVVRDDKNKPISLSEGQKLMIRAGLSKLKILEDGFADQIKDDPTKHPKMLIMCEDTNVSPLICKFLSSEGFGDEEVLQIDSNKKGELPESEWQEVKQKLFSIDKRDKPKIIVSVLMLREGFDVNNICVIVPLRPSSSNILLEQTVGRGLRLMWREPEFEDLKKENRKKLLQEKREPDNYFDILTIVEHPAFNQFYEDLLKDGVVGEIDRDPASTKDITGDIISVGLKENYQQYDLFWPVIVKEKEEDLISDELDISKLKPFTIFPLENLKKFFNKDGEVFYSEEITAKTRFGDYVVNASLFNSKSYNEYLEKISNIVVSRMIKEKPGGRKLKAFPMVQINQLELVKAIDRYIRTGLFNKNFDPFEENNWKILLLKNGIVTDHIVKQIGEVVYQMQNNIKTEEAIVDKRYFSEVKTLRMRENYCLDIKKTIYEKQQYPSNKGGFEKDLLLYADDDGKIESLLKIDQYYHDFASIIYIRGDGLMSVYHPDFIVKSAEKIYIVETKSDKDLHDLNVKQKQLATLDWIKRINSLDVKLRDNRTWEYVLLGENHFHTLKNNGASVEEIFELAKISKAKIGGQLFE